MSRYDLYGTVVGSRYLPYTSSHRKELDLRNELNRTFFGASDEISKGRIGLIRRIRRDSDGLAIRCECRDQITDEPSRDFVCSDCFGMGYLFDERKIVYYKNDDAFRRWGYDLFYVEYSVEPTDKDYIIEIERDVEGQPVTPIVRSRVYKIDEAEDFRADNGRVEYWRIRASWQKKWSVWYDVPVREPGAAS